MYDDDIAWLQQIAKILKTFSTPCDVRFFKSTPHTYKKAFLIIEELSELFLAFDETKGQVKYEND